MRRSKKWLESQRPDIVLPKLESALEERFRRIDQFFTSFDAFYERITKILDEIGVVATDRAMYRALAEEIFSAAKRFSGETLKKVATAIGVKYYFYGIPKDVIVRILNELGIMFDYRTYDEGYADGFNDGYWYAFSVWTHGYTFITGILSTVSQDLGFQTEQKYIKGKLSSTSSEILSHEVTYQIG